MDALAIFSWAYRGEPVLSQRWMNTAVHREVMPLGRRFPDRADLSLLLKTPFLSCKRPHKKHDQHHRASVGYGPAALVGKQLTSNLTHF